MAAISTSAHAGGLAAGDPPGGDAVLSPIHSPQPGQSVQHARRRSHVSDDADAWLRQTNGGSRLNPDSARAQPAGLDSNPMAEGTSNAPWSAATADGFAASPRLEQGGFEPKLGRISDEAEGEGPAALWPDEEETAALNEAARKRRQQQQRGAHTYKTSDLDPPPDGSPGASIPPGLMRMAGTADAAVLHKSIINVVLIGLWYLFSLSISIYNKWMFSADHLNFSFPLFTTSTHMLVQFSLASLVLTLMPRFRPQLDLPSPPPTADRPGLFRHMFSIVSRGFYLTRLGPCGAATSLDIGLGNMSLKFISLTFFTMCKSSALAFVLLFAFVFRLEAPSIKLVLIIATMTVGVVMMVAGEVNFVLEGFALIISSSFFSGLRWALTQILLLRHPATSNPFASIFFLTPIMFVCLVAIAIPVETFAALGAGLSTLMADKGLLLGPLLLLFPGILAFCMTSAEYALLQRTSVVTLSICGIFKEVVTISAAEVVYHDPLTPINLSGLLVTIGSIGAYNYLKIQKMRQEARERVDDEGAGDGASSGLALDNEREERRAMLPEDVEMDADDEERQGMLAGERRD